jgi:hypothetical protein
MRTLRRCIAAFMLVVGISSAAFAQDEKLKDFTFDEVPSEEAKPPYFAAAGGFIVMPLFQDLSKLNETVGAITGGGSLTAPILLTGAQGFVAIGVVPNVRVGFMVAGGSGIREGTVNTVSRRTEYTVTMNGVSIDYAFMPFKGFAILPGVTGGWGTVSFEANQSSGSRSFGSTFPFPASQNNYTSYIKASHIFVQPNVNIEYAFSLLTMVRLNVGYSASFMQQWRVDNVSPIDNVPASLNASGLTAQLGFFVGLFNN